MFGSQAVNPGLGRKLCEVFGHIFIINLPDRADRRREMDEQLARLGLSLEDPHITLFEAVRPGDKGEWPSIGARGCFMSHLGVLQMAAGQGLERILVLEDDINWTGAFVEGGDALLDELLGNSWNYVHGGLDGYLTGGAVRSGGLADLEPETEVMLAHFVGWRGEAIARATRYLEAMVARPAGDPAGGAMHVDGAYCWFRRENPDIRSFICHTAVAYQRPSQTDIYPLGWRDRTPGVAYLMRQARHLKNLWLRVKR